MRTSKQAALVFLCKAFSFLQFLVFTCGNGKLQFLNAISFLLSDRHLSGLAVAEQGGVAGWSQQGLMGCGVWMITNSFPSFGGLPS